jgi:hypothetical protein
VIGLHPILDGEAFAFLPLHLNPASDSLLHSPDSGVRFLGVNREIA